MSDDKINLSLSLTNPPRRVPIVLSKDASSADLFQASSVATSIPVSGMKLIYRGRIIPNKDANAVLSEFALDDGCVIHCMGKPAVAVNTSVAAASTTSSTSSTAASVTASTVIPPSATSTSSTNNAAAATTSASASASPNTLKSAMTQMKSSHTASDYTTAITTLQKILGNIVTKPQEEKYRKVKRANAAFQKRLGRLNGAHDIMTMIGFSVNDDNEYVLVPSPEAWPKLVEGKKEVDRLVTEDATATAAAAAANMGTNMNMNNRMNTMGFGGSTGGMPGMGGMGGGMPGMGGMGGMPPMPAGMDPSMISNIMSNPQALQSMLSNPMVQQMMQNHPQFANNPMMQQQMRMLANNPQMVEQISRMMGDPNMAQMMANRGGMGAGAGGMPGAGAGAGGMPPMPNNNNMGGMNAQQMEMMRQFASTMGGAGAGNNAGIGAGSQPSQNQSANQSGNGNATNNSNNGTDGEMTEEEMIAAAIARSLREQ